MFAGLNPGPQRVFVVAAAHGDARLGDPWAGVEVVRHEMHGGPVPAVASRQHPSVGIEAGVFGEQRWMNVDHPPLVFPA